MRVGARVHFYSGMNCVDALPFVDQINAEEIDLLLVSHFHLDHCGALPWLLQKTTFKGMFYDTRDESYLQVGESAKNRCFFSAMCLPKHIPSLSVVLALPL